MESGTEGDAPNPWGLTLLQTVRAVQPRTASQQSAYDKWLDQRSTREEARRDRVHGAAGVIPSPLWIVLFFISAVIFVYMLFFADSGEGRRDARGSDGLGHAVIVTMLLLLAFLDNPFHSGVGGLKPVAMERSLRSSTTRCRRSPRVRSRRATQAGIRSERGFLHRPRRTDRHDPARGRHRCDGMERLPGEPLERRGHKGDGARQRRARGVHTPVRPRQLARAGRPRRLHPVGRRVRERRDPAPGLLLRALPPRVQARRRRLDRDEAAEEPERTAQPFRDAPVHVRGAGRGGQAPGGRGRLGRDGADGTSSARPTTCSAWCCSPRRCSSPA